MKSILDFTKDLGQWVTGIIEDDPLPVEIKYIYFLIVKEKKGYHLEFGGKEIKEEVVFYLDYLPLEGEFFVYNYRESIDEFILILEQAIDMLFDEQDFAEIFRDKEIYISVIGENFSKKLFT